MNGKHRFPTRIVGRLCLAIGLLSLGVLTPALAGHDVHHEVLAPAYGFDNNGMDDLAVGVPFEWVGMDANAGAVHVM